MRRNPSFSFLGVFTLKAVMFTLNTLLRLLHIKFTDMGVEGPRQGPGEQQLAVAERITHPICCPRFPARPPVPVPTCVLLENVLSSSVVGQNICHIRSRNCWICCLRTQQHWYLMWSNVQKKHAWVFTGKSPQGNGNFDLFAYLFIYPVNLFGIWTDKREQSWRVRSFFPLMSGEDCSSWSSNW